jgi:AcrR family transcriptional regulator
MIAGAVNAIYPVRYKMKPIPKKRGRPRAFATDVVLDRATDTFLHFGYAGSSLEALTSAMGLNKPSLYAAFGDKHSLFARVLRERTEALGQRYRAAFERGATLEESLAAMLEEAVEANLGDKPQGCLLVGVSTAEALADADVAKYARDFFALSDRVLAKWIDAKYAPAGAISAKTISQIINGVIHDMTLRARVGESAAKLRDYARSTAHALARAATATP